MDVVVEESETEYPSFSMKKKRANDIARVKRSDSGFDQVIDQVLDQNRERSRTP